MRLIFIFSLIFFTSINRADYRVDYGDGTSSTITAQPWTTGSHPQIASHQYTADGFYTVTITADVDCDNDGNADTDRLIDTLQVIVGNVTQQWDYGDGQRTTSSTDPCSQALTAQSHQYDTAGTYTVTYTAKETNGQITNKTIEVTVASGSGGGEELADNFNCIETTATDANAAIKQIYTKLAGTPFNLDIVALKNGEVIKNNYNKTVTVEIIDQSSGNSVYSDVNFEFAITDNARKQLTLQIDKAYKNLLCKVTYTAGATATFGTSDNFSVRPTDLTITSNLTNASSSGIPKAKAGDSFTLTATATLGYTGIPKIDNTMIQAHVGSIQSGSISGSFNMADSATGIAIGNAFSYSEVGSLRFTAQGIYDDNFTVIDQASDCTDDFSNTPDADGKVGCKFGITSTSDYFGRFTPDHFKITASINGVFADACTGFTYNGQTFSYLTAPTLTVTAYNGLGTPTVTENYTGSSYAKLIATDFNVTAPTTDSTQMGTDGSTLINIESWTPGTPSLADNGDGSLTFAFGADDYKYQHENNSKIASFIPTIDLSFSNITDSDSIQTQGLPHAIQASGSSMRFGRLNISNTHGTELNSLVIPVTTEYFNGNSFITNASDSCTALTLATHFSISDPKDTNCSFISQDPSVSIGAGSTSVSPASFTLNSGKYNLQLSAPGSGNTGFLDITSNLRTSLDSDNRSWLKYDWNADNAHDDCPSARATFGIYKGNSKQIYFREIY